VQRASVVTILGRTIVGVVAGLLLMWIALRGLRFSIMFAVVLCAVGGFVIFRAVTGFNAARRKE
jgi:hypothetical protein